MNLKPASRPRGQQPSGSRPAGRATRTLAFIIRSSFCTPPVITSQVEMFDFGLLDNLFPGNSIRVTASQLNILHWFAFFRELPTRVMFAFCLRGQRSIQLGSRGQPASFTPYLVVYPAVHNSPTNQPTSCGRPPGRAISTGLAGQLLQVPGYVPTPSAASRHAFLAGDVALAVCGATFAQDNNGDGKAGSQVDTLLHCKGDLGLFFRCELSCFALSTGAIRKLGEWLFWSYLKVMWPWVKIPYPQ